MEKLRICRVGLVGVGSVGKYLLDIILKKKEILRTKYGIEFRFCLLADSSGVAYTNAEEGFDIKEVLLLKRNNSKISSLPEYILNKSCREVLESLPRSLDLLFEASPVNINDGEPGLSISKAALSRGTHVVLANKGPIVIGYDELTELARKNSVKMMFSATVCGGLPVVNIGRNMIAADIECFRGIFNSTTNFILSELQNDRSYEDALKEAQERGIAETDPSLDVEGWDTANKLFIIVRTILGQKCTLKDVQVEGITNITPQMIKEALKTSQVYKLVATAQRTKDGYYTMIVKPTLLHKSSFLANTEGWEMAVEIQSDLFGTQYHKINEREAIPTSAAMLRDSINILNDQKIAM